MKIVLDWLQDFVALPDEVASGKALQPLVDGLIALGHEVEGIETGEKAAGFSGVVVGKVRVREPHPNADRLGVCTVEVGEAQPRTIVCGGVNVRAGITVAVALPGAVLPAHEVGGPVVRIGSGKIRGVASDGMICGISELGLAPEVEGPPTIWEMPEHLTAGVTVTPAMADDQQAQTNQPAIVLDVAITPNRGDCLSHLGIARDVAAIASKDGWLGELAQLQMPAAGTAAAEITLATQTPDCPVISACVVRGVRATQASPDWMQRRLQAVGIKPRNALVDATNYVMLAVGQPLHAYDLAQIGSGLVADAAKAGEIFRGLNGVEITLQGAEVVTRSADDGRILDLGGILGGATTGVSETTTAVVLKAAWFDRARTALTGQAHQLHTDARARFERGVDPALSLYALRLCAAYVAAWAEGEVSEIVTVGTLPPGMPGDASEIVYDSQVCATFGGLSVVPQRQQAILERLGFRVEASDTANWKVTPPSYRTTLRTPEDLVEEVLRVIGFENVPSMLPPVMPGQPAIESHLQGSRPVKLDRTARKVLAAHGVTEAVTYAFIGRADATRFAAEPARLIEVTNPLAETSMTTLRPSLLPGLLRAWQGNFARNERVALLGEVGAVYSAPRDAKGKGAPSDKPFERREAAVLLSHDDRRPWRGEKVAPVDVFAAKGLAETLLADLLNALGQGLPSLTTLAGPGDDHAGVYHPGRSGRLAVGPFELARFGELHPALLAAMDIDMHRSGPLAALELNLTPLLKLQAKAKPFSVQLYPAVKRDLALLVPMDVPAAAVQATLGGIDRALVREVGIFDLYQGEHVPVGKKSLGLALTLQADDRTLTEAEISAVMEKALGAAKDQHQAELRS